MILYSTLRNLFESKPSTSRSSEVIKLSGGGCNRPDYLRACFAMVNLNEKRRPEAEQADLTIARPWDGWSRSLWGLP